MYSLTLTTVSVVKYYLVLWEEENSVSVVPATSVVDQERAIVGERCDVSILRKRYPARIAAEGQYNYTALMYLPGWPMKFDTVETEI